MWAIRKGATDGITRQQAARPSERLRAKPSEQKKKGRVQRFGSKPPAAFNARFTARQPFPLRATFALPNCVPRTFTLFEGILYCSSVNIVNVLMPARLRGLLQDSGRHREVAGVGQLAPSSAAVVSLRHWEQIFKISSAPCCVPLIAIGEVIPYELLPSEKTTMPLGRPKILKKSKQTTRNIGGLV